MACLPTVVGNPAEPRANAHGHQSTLLTEEGFRLQLREMGFLPTKWTTSWIGLAVFTCSLGNRQIPSTPTPATTVQQSCSSNLSEGNDHVHSESADPRRGVADLAGDGRDRQAPAWRPLPEPKVLFGDDVGFRVEGMRGEVPTGVIVIKVNGN